MPEQEMNRVQRRLWRAFMRTGADTTESGAVERLHRLVQDEVATMSPALRHVMRVVLFQRGEVDYRQLASEVERHEGVHLSMASLRKRVSRATALIERAIETELSSTTRWMDDGVPHLDLRPAPPVPPRRPHPRT